MERGAADAIWSAAAAFPSCRLNHRGLRCPPTDQGSAFAQPHAARAWTPAAFAALRDRTVAQAASALAAAGQLAALPLLLDLHPRALAPSVLDVLDCIPETVPAKQLAPLLRQVGGRRDGVCGRGQTWPL